MNFAEPPTKGFRNHFAKQLLDFKADNDWSIGQFPDKIKSKIRTKPDGHIFAKELFDKDLNKREYMGDRLLCLVSNAYLHGNRAWTETHRI